MFQKFFWYGKCIVYVGPLVQKLFSVNTKYGDMSTSSKLVFSFYIWIFAAIYLCLQNICTQIWFFLVGKGNHPKLLPVSSCGCTRLEARVDMGQEWNNLVNDWCFCNPTRELLDLKVRKPTLLQERPCNNGFTARRPSREQIRGLLPWWCSWWLGYQSFQVIFILSTQSWQLGRKFDRVYTSTKSYFNGTWSWLHLWFTIGCCSYSIFNYRGKKRRAS